MTLAPRPPHRRQLLLAAAAALAMPSRAQRGTWPEGPVRITLAYPPGGLSDGVVRELATHLSPLLGVPVEQQRRKTYQVLKWVGLQHRALAALQRQLVPAEELVTV